MKTIVLANGCFDILHAGHVAHLQEAALLGGELVVALTIDEAVNKGPGRPINSWRDRKAVLMALRCVDRVVPCRNGAEAILEVKPQFYVKGRDYRLLGLKSSEKNACLHVGAKIEFTKAEKMSSTSIIQRIRAS